jgi:hypothetical protein
MKYSKIINIKSGEPYDEWVGNGSQWEIPPHIKGTKEEQIKQYEEWILKQKWLMEDIPSLRGKTLACSYKPGPCHGDVLVKLANDSVNDEKIIDIWEDEGTWYILHNEQKICMNTEETARMLLRLLK